MNYFEKIIIPKDKVYFSSDWHLFHTNVIKHDNRPFNNTEEMNEAIISNFEHLTEQDTLCYLGDMSFGRPDKTLKLLNRLKCKIIYIYGNHDRELFKDKEFPKRFYKHYPQKEILIDLEEGKRQRIMLNHYSMDVWNQSHRQAWCLFGHSHGSLPDKPNTLSLDVGCNIWEYKPISYLQIEERMKLKTFIPIDHHDERD